MMIFSKFWQKMKIFSKFQQNWWFFSILLKFWKNHHFFAMKKIIIFKRNLKFWKNLHFLLKFWKNYHLAMSFIVATLLWQYKTVLFKCRLVLFSVVLEGLFTVCGSFWIKMGAIFFSQRYIWKVIKIGNFYEILLLFYIPENNSDRRPKCFLTRPLIISPFSLVNWTYRSSLRNCFLYLRGSCCHVPQIFPLSSWK